MRWLVPVLLLAGCARFSAPQESDFELLASLRPPPGPFARVRATVDLDSPWLAGTFEAAIVARSGADPAVRIQLFPDLGGKALDLAVRRDRITGCFPQAGEGIDWALPGEARAHPLLFMGVTLLERFAPVTRDRVLGVRAGEFLVRPVVDGVTFVVGRGRRFRWSPGVEWTEEGSPFEEVELRAPDFRMRVRVREAQAVERMDESLLSVVLPPEIRRR